MQSGKAHADVWVLEYAPESAAAADPLMGYTSSTDMHRQIKMEFASLDDAVAYAERNGIPYRVAKSADPVVKPQSYADNFRYARSQPWTH